MVWCPERPAVLQLESPKGPRPGRGTRTPRGGAATPGPRVWRPQDGPRGRDTRITCAGRGGAGWAGGGVPRRVEPRRLRWRWRQREAQPAAGRRVGLARAGKRPRVPGSGGTTAAQPRPSGLLSTCPPRSAKESRGWWRQERSQWSPHLRWRKCLGCVREGGGGGWWEVDHRQFGDGDGTCVKVPRVPNKLSPARRSALRTSLCLGVDIPGIRKAGHFPREKKKRIEPTSQEIEGILNDSGPVFASSVKWVSHWVGLEREPVRKEDTRFN